MFLANVIENVTDKIIIVLKILSIIHLSRFIFQKFKNLVRKNKCRIE